MLGRESGEKENQDIAELDERIGDFAIKLHARVPAKAPDNQSNDEGCNNIALSKNMTKQGQDFQNKLNQGIQQRSALTPEQQANANALKAGQPLPQTKAPVAPAASAAPVPVGPKPTGLGFANEERDGWYYDAITKDWYTQPQ